MITNNKLLKFAAFSASLLLGSFAYQKSATAAVDPLLPALVQYYAVAKINFREDPLRNSMQAVYATTWLGQIQNLLYQDSQVAIQNSRYCSTALGNYEYIFRKMERFGLDDDPLAVPNASYIALENFCSR